MSDYIRNEELQQEEKSGGFSFKERNPSFYVRKICSKERNPKTYVLKNCTEFDRKIITQRASTVKLS